MSPTTPGAVPAGAFSRRTLLAAAAAGAAAVAGCTSSADDSSDAVTPAQVDQLAAQVAAQDALVTAYDQALAAVPGLGEPVQLLASQARAQLGRLRAAAPGAGPSASPAGSAPAPADPPLPADPAGARAFLRAAVTRTADAHAAACPGFSGGRAALLGSIAAGLRGAGEQLA